jgi:rare lipoprotein A
MRHRMLSMMWLVWLGGIILLAGCGHGKARASIPTSKGSAATGRISDSELEGIASYYAEPYNGRRTASGEIFDSYHAMTAAHKTLPFDTVVRVKNLDNGKEVDVRINDRGPFVKGRVIDLSLLAAKEIGLDRAGIAPVKLKILKDGSPTTIPPVPAVVPAPPPLLAPPLPVPVVPIPAPAEPTAEPTVPNPIPIESELPAPSVAPPSDAAAYGVQVGAFQSQSAAEKLRDDLLMRYNDVSIQVAAGDAPLFRVRVGRLAEMDAAEQLAKKLRSENFSTFVVRIN